MRKLSIIIPSYKDPFLQKTIDSILKNAKGNIEIIPVLDGYSPEKPIKKDKKVKPIIFKINRGMRAAINAGISKAKGSLIMKCDSHCIFGPGFDKIMIENFKNNWLMVPRRFSLDEINWKRDEKRTVRDYHYLTYAIKTKDFGVCMSSQDWIDRTYQRRDPKYEIDDTMIFQGSCWLANKKYFKKTVGKLDGRKNTYGQFGGEQVEIGLKYWLKGGEIKVIKKTWYAHLLKRPRHYQKGLFTRQYKINENSRANRAWSAKHWMNNKEPGIIHPISWLVEKFWPVPTWPEDRSKWIFPKNI